MTASQNATSPPPLLSRAELRACLIVLLIAAAWSALLSCIYWPGLATEDGATRSVHALALLSEPKIIPKFLSHWFPPGLTLLMSASLRWFGSLGPVTMLQAFWVAASMGWLLVLSAGPRLGLIFLALPLIYPPLFTHSIAHLADGWSVAALASLTCCTLLWHRRAKSQHTLQSPSWLRALITLLLVSSCLALLTFRANGVTVMPLLAICMLWLVRPATRAIAGLVVIGACMAATPFLIQNIPWPRRDTVATSLIWEHVGMLKLSQDPKLATQYSLDDVCIPPANTKSLIERHNWVTHDSIMFRSPQVLQSSKVMKADDNVVRKRFKELASNEPLLYLRMKLQTWRTLMGLRGGIPLIYIWNKAPTWTQPLGTSFERTGPLKKWSDPINKWNASNQMRLEYSALPIIWISGALLALAACFIQKKPCWPAMFCLLYAAAYYGAFFLITPGTQYRYFMPAHALLYVALISAITTAIRARTSTLSSYAATQTTNT